MNEPVKIRKIFGKYQVEFHLFTGCFYCKIGDVEFRDESYNLLLRKIKHSNLIIIDEDVYFKEFSGFERKRVMRLEYFEGYFYDEEEIQHRLEYCYHMTEENKKVMEEAKTMKDKGWNLIHGADVYLSKNLKQFPKNHWQNLFDKKVKEWKEDDAP